MPEHMLHRSVCFVILLGIWAKSELKTSPRLVATTPKPNCINAFNNPYIGNSIITGKFLPALVDRNVRERGSFVAGAGFAPAGATCFRYAAKVGKVEYEDENGQKATKKYIKGARLCMYPPGFHIFRWSKGIKKPAVTLTSYKQAKEKISSAKLTFSKTVFLEDTESNFSNTITYEYYNSIRK